MKRLVGTTFLAHVISDRPAANRAKSQGFGVLKQLLLRSLAVVKLDFKGCPIMAGSVSLSATLRCRAWYQVQRIQTLAIRQSSHVKRIDERKVSSRLAEYAEIKQDRRGSLPISDTR